MQAEVPSPRRRLPVASPALAIDDEHKRPTLEQRLDAAVLAAGATPPRGVKVAKAKALVPLRLDAPTAPIRARESVDRAAPAPRMLQFLLDDATRVGGEESVSRIPRLAPVVDSRARHGAVGVRTNIYRLDTIASDDVTVSRPLPLVDDEYVTVVGRPVSKVMTVLTASADNVSISAFSFVADDDDIDRTDEGGHISRAPHAAAAVGLRALSDEGDDDFGANHVDTSAAHLEELARQLGLTGLAVPRSGMPRLVSAQDLADDDGVDLAALKSALDEPAENSDRSGESFAALQSELLAEFGDQNIDDDVPPLKATDPMRVARRPVALQSIIVHGDEDDDGDLVDEFADDEPSNTLRLPASLLSSGFDDDTEVTPPHGTVRLSLEAPDAVRFVIAQAPARVVPPTAEEIARNQGRAHDLYLVALDDIACRDAESAIVHLQLALAYDDDTSLYGDLLAQLERNAQKRAS